MIRVQKIICKESLTIKKFPKASKKFYDESRDLCTFSTKLFSVFQLELRSFLLFSADPLR